MKNNINKEVTINVNKSDIDLLIKKLEYRFKNSDIGKELIAKLKKL